MSAAGLDLTSIIAFIVTGIVILLSAFKLYLYLTLGKFDSKIKMEGKTVIITGANSGIGKETARDLAKRGARIIMACRNLDTAKEARDEIAKETNNENVIVKKIDMSSLKSIRKFAEDIINTEQVIDVLIHNAGFALGLTRAQSEDGIELTMATNYYGPFLLTHLLIDMLKKSEQGRIVTVSSKLYIFASVNLNNLNPINFLPPFHLYSVSKFATIMFTQELARRLKGTKITANCLHPGVIATEIWRNIPFPLNLPFSLIKKCFKTPADGAQTTIFCAASPNIEHISGKYFRNCQVYRLNRKVQDVETAKKLWELSKAVVKLTPNDPKI